MSIFISNKYTTWYYNIITNAQKEDRSKGNGVYYEKHHIIPKSIGGTNDNDNLILLTGREHFICHLLLPNMLLGVNKRNMVFGIWYMIHGDPSKNNQRYVPNSYTYEILKRKIANAQSELHKGKIVSEETRKKISIAATGRKSLKKGKTNVELYGEEKALKMAQKASESHKGNPVLPETVEKILKSRSWYTHSDETKRKIGESNKGRTVVITEETKQKISIKLKGRSNYWLKGKPAHNKGKPHTKETLEKQRQIALKREKIKCPHCLCDFNPGNYKRWHGDKCKHK